MTDETIGQTDSDTEIEPTGAPAPVSASEPEETPGTEEGMGESIAVPAGDLTGAITEAIEEFTDKSDEEATEPR
jgi:hypothetical protein